MGKGLIPADGEVWRARRRAIVPALHKKYVASMVGMFGDCTLHGCGTLDKVRGLGGDRRAMEGVHPHPHLLLNSWHFNHRPATGCIFCTPFQHITAQCSTVGCTGSTTSMPLPVFLLLSPANQDAGNNTMQTIVVVVCVGMVGGGGGGGLFPMGVLSCVCTAQAAASGKPIDMENYFSRLALDIIGKAVFNYDFDSLTHDDPVIQVGCCKSRCLLDRSPFFVPPLLHTPNTTARLNSYQTTNQTKPTE